MYLTVVKADVLAVTWTQNSFCDKKNCVCVCVCVCVHLYVYLFVYTW